MALHQYACPTCGVSLQAAQDVSGRKVRCLGCQTVFVAVAASSQPARRPSRTEPEELPTPELPPIPRSRKVPAVAVVVAGSLMMAVALTVFVVKKYKPAA